MNVRKRVVRFCNEYIPPKGSKPLTTSDHLKASHWRELENLHDQLEIFYEATLMVEGECGDIAKHFKALHWLMIKLDMAGQKFLELGEQHRRSHDAPAYQVLREHSHVAWAKAEKYFQLYDNTPAYYAAVALNPTVKMLWFKKHWSEHPEKKAWIPLVKNLIVEFWSEYKGKSLCTSAPTSTTETIWPARPHQQSPGVHFTDLREHMDVDSSEEEEIPLTDNLELYFETNRLKLSPAQKQKFDPITYWIDRLSSQADLAQMALDVFAAPAMSDECERLFSSCKILLDSRRSNLKMDIIEANECLRHWFGKPKKDTFDDEVVGILEGEPQTNRKGSQDSSWTETVKKSMQTDIEAISSLQPDEPAADEDLPEEICIAIDESDGSDEGNEESNEGSDSI